VVRMVDYIPQEIEKKWQEKWKKDKIFEVKMDPNKKKYYVLEMYPYPSSHLHMGHLRNYSIGDAYARYKRMRGFNVLYPMGYDSFGLPAENAAIDHGVNPEEWTDANINAIKEQQERIGLSYDWTRMIYSHDINYYKWDQWFFLKMYERGLAYRENAYANWCPTCATVLANEQVQGGKCWRCNSDVEQKFLTQWFLKIRAYAEELLEGLNHVDWPEKVKVMQRNWIGRSEGSIIKFPIMGENRSIDIFTTRPDTLFGVTFMVFAPEHPWVREWVQGTEYEKSFQLLYEEVMKQNKYERSDIDIEKKGMFIGKYCLHPLTNEHIPIYISNFVIYEYGAGAVMAVPAHDQRDFEFAKKYNLPIKIVIQPFDHEINLEKMSRAYEGNGVLVNSQEFDGLDNETAKKAITDKLESLNKGKPTVNYKLRDWLISRQRFWGCPIPIIYCNDCGIVPVPYEDLPVKLPKDVKFTGKGNPLETSEKFKKVKCPKCGKMGRRETNTMDTFVDSSWYFFKFCDPEENGKLPYRKELIDYWGNVDQYIGGIEHAVMHLLYARFWTKVSRDLGLHSHDEPFQKLLTQGMINKAHPYCPTCNAFAIKSEMNNKKCKRCGTDYVLKSVKMSKSLGNTVDPIGIMTKYGADSSRFFILFGASPESGLEWSDEAVIFANRFLKNLFKLITEPVTSKRRKKTINDTLILYNLNKTIKNITIYLENIEIRDAINQLIQFTSELIKYKRQGPIKTIFSECIKKLTLMLHPFVPHITEELWEILGKKSYISLAKWPTPDDSILTKENDYKWNLMNSTVDDIKNIINVLNKNTIEEIKLMIAAPWKYDFYQQLMKLLEQTKNQGEIIKVLMKNETFKSHGKFINLTINKILKNVGKYPKLSLSAEIEFNFFTELKPIFENKFNCKIKVLHESESDNKKAKDALPGKPAILIT